MTRILEYETEPEFDGARLDTVLRAHYHMSGSLIKELKKTRDGLLINGTPARSIDIVRTGDKIRITMIENGSENIEPVKLDFKIVYEDEDILIVSKPAGMPTHISAGNYRNTLANAVIYHYKAKGEDFVFRAVNRLDKDTSGLMCIAKNKFIHARLCSCLNSKAVHRRYIAILCGKCEGCGTIDIPIARDENSAVKRKVSPGGARAVTHYNIIRNSGEYSLAELELETGRTHQIRVHMAYIGFPLLGDWLYGKEDKRIFPRQALHSYYLAFNHPLSGKFLEFYDPIPKNMLDIMGISSLDLRKTNFICAG